jgi:hypothetical protein
MRCRCGIHVQFNFDEASWKCYLDPHKVIVERGTKKECYTGCGCISAAGEKLPFWIVTKGKTDPYHLDSGSNLM